MGSPAHVRVEALIGKFTAGSCENQSEDIIYQRFIRIFATAGVAHGNELTQADVQRFANANQCFNACLSGSALDMTEERSGYCGHFRPVVLA